MHNGLTDVKGLKVGHYTDTLAATGCTVVLCESGAVAGVDVRGSAPGTRETALLNPLCMIEKVHAVLLTGGSAYGLNAAAGVMQYLEERGHGFDVGVAKVPIVPAAVLFDLAIGRADVRPTAENAYAACLAASDGPVAEGNVGAGTGCTIGKALGARYCVKSGLGTASEKIGKGVVVSAMVALNAFGDIRDPESGKVVAAVRKPAIGGFGNTVDLMKGTLGQTMLQLTNTTLAVVATNAGLSKPHANKVAQMAHDGLAMTIHPVHTTFDGDTVFALATGDPEKDRADVNVIGAVAAQVLARAVVRAVQQADGLAGVPALRQLG